MRRLPSRAFVAGATLPTPAGNEVTTIGMTQPPVEPLSTDDLEAAVRRERETLLGQVQEALDGAMVALSVAWVALLVVELGTGSLPPILDAAVWVIWAAFLADFALEFSIAPAKLAYLRTNWLTAVSLVLPAVRIVRAFAALRVLRAARVVRSVGFLRILTSTNRGLASLRRTAARRGLRYVVAATLLVMLVGSAGMAYFETPAATGGNGTVPIASYADALWWTAYAMTTGATAEPVTAEGRVLGWILSLYGLGVFGYLTAALASHFVGTERASA